MNSNVEGAGVLVVVAKKCFNGSINIVFESRTTKGAGTLKGILLISRGAR